MRVLHARHQPRPRTATSRIAAAVGMTGEQMYEMYRLLAIAKYEERYVIPTAHAEEAPPARGARHCSLDFDGGPGMDESGPFGEASGRPAPSRSRPSTRSSSDRPPTSRRSARRHAARVNLLNWDGKGRRRAVPAREATHR